MHLNTLLHHIFITSENLFNNLKKLLTNDLRGWCLKQKFKQEFEILHACVVCGSTYDK